MNNPMSKLWNGAVLVIVLYAFMRALQGWWLLTRDFARFIKMLIKGEYHS